MAKAILVGETVMEKCGSTYVYGGLNKNGPGWFSLEMRMLERVTRVFCDPTDVIPVEHAGDLNLKDSRIVITNCKETKPRSATGPWYGSIQLPDGSTYTGWFKTKRDGTRELATRLMIADWHEVTEA